jgi:hypothetical protein
MDGQRSDVATPEWSDGGSSSRGERTSGHPVLELIGVARVVEQVRVDAQRRRDVRVAKDPADLRDIEAEMTIRWLANV